MKQKRDPSRIILNFCYTDNKGRTRSRPYSFFLVLLQKKISEIPNVDELKVDYRIQDKEEALFVLDMFAQFGWEVIKTTKEIEIKENRDGEEEERVFYRAIIKRIPELRGVNSQEDL